MSATFTPEETVAPVRKGDDESSHASQAVLKDLFTRLSAKDPTASTRPSEGSTPVGPDKNMFAFEDRPGSANKKTKAAETTRDSASMEKANPVEEKKPLSVESLAEKLFLSEEVMKRTQAFVGDERAEKAKSEQSEADHATGIQNASLTQVNTPVEKRVRWSQEELEAEYMRKASKYVDILPVEQSSAVYLIHVVSKKLRSIYAEDGNGQKSNDSIKARFAFALANYINKVIKKGQETFSVDAVKSLLKDADGDLMELCAKLVAGKYISLQTLDDVNGMAKAFVNILPEVGASVLPHAMTNATTVENTEVIDNVVVKPVSKDPVENMKGWPSQEKRENRESTLSFFVMLILTS